jgi:preprotein translocase subunit SecG
METAALILHLLAALAIIGLVLLQHGKGADAGAAFGGGASGSIFGSSGSANFMSRTTAVLAAVFFVTSLGLSWYSTQGDVEAGVMSKQPPSGSAPASTPSDPAKGLGSAPPAMDESKTKDIPK